MITANSQWHRVMLFYHIAVRAEAYSALNESGSWRSDAFDVIASLQHADGHFANPDGGPNKEDDPILATSMMVETLARVSVGGVN